MDDTEQLSELQKAMEAAKDKVIPKLKTSGVPREIQKRVEQLDIPKEPVEASSLLSKEVQA